MNKSYGSADIIVHDYEIFFSAIEKTLNAWQKPKLNFELYLPGPSLLSMHIAMILFLAVAFTVLDAALGTLLLYKPVYEPWPVTSMLMHFMGPDSGLPGGAWPHDAIFPTKFFFVVQVGREEIPS